MLETIPNAPPKIYAIDSFVDELGAILYNTICTVPINNDVTNDSNTCLSLTNCDWNPNKQTTANDEPNNVDNLMTSII
jgi:hypothetical protein